MKRTFIYTDEKSNKFWSIESNGTSYTVNYGKVDTTGQTQTKEFDTEEACKKAVEKLIAEKVKKGYVEEGASETPSTSDKTIPSYEGHKCANIEANQFVVDLEDKDSIASVLQYQIENVEKFLERFDKQVDNGRYALMYGAIENDKFVAFSNMNKYTSKRMYYDEEILANAISGFPELFPLVAEYAKKVILRASKEEKTSGPWATEETIFGQEIIPMLANADVKFLPLLKTLMKTNVEIKFSPNFGEVFRMILEATEAKHAIASGKQPEDKVTKLFRSFMKNYKTDVEYVLDTGNQTTDNKFSLYNLSAKFGYNSDRSVVFPKLMAVVKEELKKGKIAYDDIIYRSYCMLIPLGNKIPLKRLKEVIEDIKTTGNVPENNAIVKEDHEWDFWELPNPLGGEEGRGIEYTSLFFDDKKSLESILRQLIDHFDQYQLSWSYGDSFHITNLSRKEGEAGRNHNREHELFEAIAKFPELAPLVASYVDKLTEEHKKKTVLRASGNFIYVYGATAAAAMVAMDEKYDEKLLEYLNTIPSQYYDTFRTGNVYNDIKHLWKKIGKPLNLPKTFVAHPKLTEK